MSKTYSLLICLSAGILASQFSAIHKTKNDSSVYFFKNGKWFTGTEFEIKDFYTADGKLTSNKPKQVDSTIDLSGKFIIPPFSEAHTHNIGFPPTENEMKPYIKNGIFYVMVQSNSFPRRPPSQTFSPVEVIEAGALLTPSGSHITVINERSAERGNLPGVSKEELDGKTHILVNSEADLEKLKSILTERPGFIKIILAFSEEFEKRKSDTNYIGKRGLDPKLIPMITRMAHSKGIEVSAHIETAADFRLAVRSGVDIIAHLPGNRLFSDAGFRDTSIQRWLLTEEDAIEAAKSKVTVITTVTAGKTLLNPSKASYQAARQIRTSNLQLLYTRGVKIAIGSDYYEGNSLVEALLLGKQALLGAGIEPLGIFDNLALLQLWSRSTPQFIFPGRKIGELRNGYEASFLVLPGNPVEDFKWVTKIEMRMKNGRIL